MRAGLEVNLDEVGDALAGPSTAPDVALDLQRCLLCLPEGERTVLLLVTLEDMPYAAVASILPVPLGTVMSRLSRARSRLRELMDGAVVQPPRSSDTAPHAPRFAAIRAVSDDIDRIAGQAVRDA